MQRTNSQRTSQLLPAGWRFFWLSLASLLACWPVAALSQDPFSMSQFASQANLEESDPLPFDEMSGRGGQAMGAVFRAGFLNGPAVGREDSLVPIELMPYFFLEDGMLFGDLRGFRSVDDGFGANVGFGYRQYLRKWDRILGANAYFDYDNTSGQLFRQTGFGVETLGALWDMRFNVYLPVGETRKSLGLSRPQDLRFAGNNILFDQIETFGVALKGFDHELAVPLPGRFLERHNVRGVAGWYHFQQTDVKNTWGWRGRLQGDITSNIQMGLEVTNDNTFDTNVVFSVAFTYGGFKEPEGRPRTQFSRMTDHVNRFYNVVVQRQGVLIPDQIAQNADGSNVYVEHVASQTPYDRNNLPLMLSLAPQYDPNAPLGTYENPFLTIAAAQGNATPIADIVYVWTNSQFSGTVDAGANPNNPNPVAIQTEAGVRLLGEADDAPHLININGFDVLLPRAVDNRDPDPNNPLDTAVADQRPSFIDFDDPNNPIVDGVALVSGTVDGLGNIKPTEFSGFTLGDPNVLGSGPTGNGIRAPSINGESVTNVVVNYVNVNNTGQDGVLLENAGTISFLGTRIFNPGDNGFHVDGGTPLITFSRDPNLTDRQIADIQNSTTGANQLVPAGAAVLIENTLAGSLVNMRGNINRPFTQIDFSGANGILIQNAAGSATFARVAVQNSPGDAISILNSGGVYQFLEDPNASDITRFLPSGVQNVRGRIDLNASGEININNPLGDGINIQNLAATGRVSFEGEVNITDRNAIGVDLVSNQGDVRFGQRGGAVRIYADDTSPNLLLSPAFNYQASSGSVNIGGNISIANGDGVGLLIGEFGTNNTGLFQVSGNTDISNMGGISLLIVDDDSRVQFADVNIGTDFSTGSGIATGRLDTGIAVLQQRNSVLFRDVTVEDGSDDTAVIIRGSPVFAVGAAPPPAPNERNGTVTFNLLEINGATAPNALAVAGLQVQTMQADVLIRELNIQSQDGIAFQADRVGDPYRVLGNRDTSLATLEVDSGVITAQDSRAVDITESEISVRLESVSADDSAFEGIRLENNRQGTGRNTNFAFEVFGGGGINGTGGQFAGIRLINTGDVSLTGMQVSDAGGAGIDARNEESTIIVNGISVLRGVDVDPDLENDPSLPLPVFTQRLNALSNVVTDSTHEGLRAIDIPTVLIIGGLYEGNGDTRNSFDDEYTDDGLAFDQDDQPLGASEIRLVATRALTPTTGNASPRYEFTLTDVEVNEAGESDAVQITTGRSTFNALGRLVDLDGNPDDGPNNLPLRLLFNALGSRAIDSQSQSIITLGRSTFGQNDNEDAALHVRWDGIIESGSGIRNYIFDTERNNSYGILVEQLNQDVESEIAIRSNLVRIGTAARDANIGYGAIGIDVDFEGPTTATGVTINDNVVFIDASAFRVGGATVINETARETIGIVATFNSFGVLTLDGTDPDLFDLSGLVPDPGNDFADGSINYVPPGATNAVTVNGPFGNIILSHAQQSVGIDLRFDGDGIADIQNNVITSEPVVENPGQIGLRLTNRGDPLELRGQRDNIILLDQGPLSLNAVGSGAPWFVDRVSNTTGTFLVNGQPVPQGP